MQSMDPKAQRRTHVLLSHLSQKRDSSVSPSSISFSNTSASSTPTTQQDLPLNVKILGVGRYVPPHVVPSSLVDMLCGKAEGYTLKTAGVKERRWVVSPEELIRNRKTTFAKNVDKLLEGKPEPTEPRTVHSTITNAFMGARAAEEALQDAGLKLQDIDYILNASGTAQHSVPDNSCFIQRELGAGKSGIPCSTVHSTCLSFLVGMQTAASLITTGIYKRILIISSDIASIGLNFQGNPHSSGLLGDGAAAVVLGPTPAGESSKIRKCKFQTFGDAALYTRIIGGGTQNHPNMRTTQETDGYFHMEGQKVLSFTAKVGLKFLEQFDEHLGKGQLGSIKCVVPHQASYAGIFMMSKVYGWPKEKIGFTLDKFGNCISASIPMTLYEVIKEGKVKRGDDILLAGSGAGLSIGAMILTY